MLLLAGLETGLGVEDRVPAEAIAVAERPRDLQRTYRERFQTARRSALMLSIIDLAFERPVSSISDVAEVPGISYGGAANKLAELIAQGVA